MRQLQESAAQLRTVYAGEKAEAIACREHEVMQYWKELLTSCEECRVQITTETDKLRFFSMVRDQIMWMESIICQIGAGEKPRYLHRIYISASMFSPQSLCGCTVLKTEQVLVFVCGELTCCVLCGSCRDVSSVEVLMNYHQSLKSEVEARSQSTLECIEMGKTLLAARNPAAEEVR